MSQRRNVTHRHRRDDYTTLDRRSQGVPRLPERPPVCLRARSGIREDAEGAVLQKTMKLTKPLVKQVDRADNEVRSGGEIALRTPFNDSVGYNHVNG